jgi:3-oxoacyl-[acyl-carrier protein] reductase
VAGDFDGLVAIVTGGGSGIGLATARLLAARGARVAVLDLDPAAAGTRPAQREAAGPDDAGTLLPLVADVADEASVDAAVAAVVARWGGVDVLVNNAGIMPLAPIAEMDDASVDRVIAVNLKGTFNTLREAARRLRQGGRIINLSSSVVALLQPTYAVYAATKAGVEAMTSVLAKELRGRNITVNAVAPGPTATDLFLKGKSQEVIDRAAGSAPLGRLGQPEDIAAAIAFLAGPDGGWINGQTLRANCGTI